MFIYTILFFITLFSSYILARQAVIANITHKYSNCRVFLSIVFIILLLFIGLRYNVGRDFPTYYYHYSYIDSSYFGLMNRYQTEFGYLAVLEISRALGFGAQGIFLISSFITLILLFRLYKNYKIFFPLGLLCFFMCDPYVFCINGLRQMLAVMFGLNAFLEINRSNNVRVDFIRYLFWIFGGSLFHSTSFLLIPVFLLRFVNYNNRFFSFVWLLLPIIGYGLNLTGLFTLNIVDIEAFSETSYNNYVGDEKMETKVGLFNLGTFLAFVIMMLPLIYRKRIKRYFSNIDVLIPIYSLGMFIMFFFYSNMLLTRISFYFTFSLLLIFPAFVNALKINSNFINNKIILTMFLLGYLVRYLYTLPAFWDNQIIAGAKIFGISIL